jgi:hypothetical protein
MMGVAAGLLSATVLAGEKDARVYEMRTYYAEAGKLDGLLARFRDHTVRLFAKHGMTNIGYWVPAENPDNKLIYVLAFPSREAREKAFKDFLADPDWQKAQKESEANGKLVAKIESVFMTATDFSPAIQPAEAGPRLFELRHYIASPNNLENLLARFRNHTLKLFEKHGIANLAYWTLMPDQKDAETTLLYIIAHKDADAAKASWAAFRADPDWTAAKKASEDKAGGSLTAIDGVKSIMMKATDFSPTK